MRDHLAAIAEDGGKTLALVSTWELVQVEEVLSTVLDLHDPNPGSTS